MSLDKLGPKEYHKEGTSTETPVHDLSSNLYLKAILDELKHIKLMLKEITEMDLDPGDTE